MSLNGLGPGLETNGAEPPGPAQVGMRSSWPDQEPRDPTWEELERDLGQLPPPGSMTLREARRLVALALVVVLGCAGLGAGVWALLPTEYAGQAELLYPVAVEQPTGFLREDRNLTTQVLLVGSRAVVEPVATANGIAVEDLQRNLTVEVVDSSEIIRIDVRSTDQNQAVRLVGDLTNRYLEIAAGTRDAPAREWVRGELERTRAQLARGPGDANLRERERALVAQLDSLTTADLARPVPWVLVPAFSVPDPVGLGVTAAMATGAVIGLLVAAPVVYLRARRRGR